jgi:hypothetical protein
VTVPAGTTYFRVHRSKRAAEAFNPAADHRYYGGSRFGSTADDPYGYCYLGSSEDVAVSEFCLRDLDVDETGPRILPRTRIEGRRLSAVTTTHGIELISLCTGAELGALSQDTWLTTAYPRDYPQTRHWGHWIRTCDPGAAGFVWRSRIEPAGYVAVLFADRCPADLLAPRPQPAWGGVASVDLDAGPGHDRLRTTLAIYGATFDTPAAP